MTAKAVLQARRARPFYGRHPWVFAGAVSHTEGDPADGDEVDLVSHTGNFIARGLYNSQSKLRVRLYTWRPDTPLDEAFFKEQLRAAIRLREQLGLMAPDGACRLVNSEGDGLSGLTVDRYGPWLALQFSSLAMGQRRDLFARLLQELLSPQGIYLRTEKGVGKLEGLDAHDGPLVGSPPPSLTIDDDGLKVQVNLAEGQKTGYYLDQRDNRREVARLARGRRVLDAFCYSGGFALHAVRAGASECVGIDSSEAALVLARANAEANGHNNCTFVRADVFNELDRRAKNRERFGVVVLDPPKFARSKRGVEDALRGYRRLLSLGTQLLEEDGFLVMCCCSGRITPDMLEELLAQVSAGAGRDLQLLARRGPSCDHPVSVACPESHYLKCLICRAR
jgi:23S rRNA (cytosine1962-C5)-methyltransferase